MDADTVAERRRLRRRASWWRAAAFLILAAALVGYFALYSGADMDRFGRGAVRDQVAEIEIDGFIGTRPDAVDILERAAKADSVKAIILRIDSGGGAASGGEALYKAVRAASEKKPVVAMIEGLGASAAYLTAIAADHVVVRESAITGSIGVIFQYGHIEDLLTKIGVEYEEIKSAPLKGQPSPFTEPTPEAEQMIQAVVSDSYDWFVGLVAERRNMPGPDVRRLADGSIYTGRQALRLNLVDAVGGEPEARAWLASQRAVPADIPSREWKKDESLIGRLTTASLLPAIARLAGFEPSLLPAAAGFLQRPLTVDGLLSVWQAPLQERSDRHPGGPS